MLSLEKPSAVSDVNVRTSLFMHWFDTFILLLVYTFHRISVCLSKYIVLDLVLCELLLAVWETG